MLKTSDTRQGVTFLKTTIESYLIILQPNSLQKALFNFVHGGSMMMLWSVFTMHKSESSSLNTSSPNKKIMF